MIVETTKNVWVTFNRRFAQIAMPIPILKKVSKRIRSLLFIHWMNFNGGRIIIVFKAIWNPHTRRSWTHCVSWKNFLEIQVICWEGSSTWRVCLCTRGTESLNYLNPLGFVSREFSLIKEFILISLAIEYFVLMISCVRPVIMFGLITSILALINRITLDWGWLRNRKKPAAKVMWKGSLLTNEKAVWFKITDG